MDNTLYIVKQDTIGLMANAIREKTGETYKITGDMIAAEILNFNNENDRQFELQYFQGGLNSNYSNPVVKTIGAEVFISNPDIVDIAFPNCSAIYSSAFANCPNLQRINFPKCYDLSANSFLNCLNLKDISLPTCITLNTSAFARCTALEYINLPKCNFIGPNAFADCTKLSRIILPSNSIVALYQINAFMNTPISTSSLTGVFGSIYVPSHLVERYKTATGWKTYSSRITSIQGGE